MNRTKRNIVSVPFRNADVVVVDASGLATLQVSPNSTMSPTLTAIAQVYDEYRFTKLRYRLHPNGPFATNPTFKTLAFYPGIVDVPPSSPSLNAESTLCVVHSGGQTTPSKWMNVPRKILAGMHSWYKSVPGTPDIAEEVQGYMFFAGLVASASWIWEVEGVCDFCSPINASSTPEARKIAVAARYRDRLLTVLSAPPISTAAVTRLISSQK
jgi:hypothetical protein